LGVGTIDLETIFDDSGSDGGRRRLVLSPDDSASRFDQPGARAIGVNDLEHASEALFGLACDPRVPVRLETAKKVCGRIVPSAIKLVSVGRAPPPPKGGTHLIMVYQRPDGWRLSSGPGDAPAKIAPRDMLTNVVAPISEAIDDWRKLDLCHGSVRPDNLYFADSSRSRVVLGEALSAPCGRWQPAALETVERSMAMPAGRGPGRPEDDVYALGATVVALLKGALPGADADDKSLTKWRLAEGSAVTIADFVDPQSALGIALYGMLADDPRERWTAEDVMRWVRDRVRPPDVSRSRALRRRSYVFLGAEYRTPKALASGLADAPSAAGPLLREGKIGDWLRHSVDNRQLADALADVLSPDHSSLGGRRVDNDELAARAAILLDPNRPISYRGTSVFPDGIGGAMADAKSADDASTSGNLVEILRLGLADFWLEQQTNKTPNFAILEQKFKEARTNFKRDEPGFGSERALYDLNPTLSCQAELVADHLILDIEQVLPTLDRIAESGPQKGRVIDRHMAGFIANRLKISSTADLNDLVIKEGTPEDAWKGALRLLAQVQIETEADPVPHLADWLARRLLPVVEKLHNRAVRKSVEDQLSQFVESGDLARMAAVALDRRTWRQDEEGFGAAVKQVAAIRERTRQLTEDPVHRSNSVERMGHQIATATAYVLLGFTLIFVAGSILA
jgi:hypothetical protein